MKKKTLIILITLILLLGFLFFYIKSITDCTIPERPSKVPKNAIWKGGKDGGFWFSFVNQQSNELIRLQIFNDYNGKMLLDANFKPEGDCHLPTGKAVINEINYYDFQKIVLNNSCELKPIVPYFKGGLIEQ